MTSICLVMIVRDEALVMERAIRSVLPLISSWRIIDTGSIDGTPELVRELLRDIPGELRTSPWADFATNRSEVIEWARGSADWLLLLDADMTIETDPNILNQLDSLTAQAALIEVVGDMSYRMPYLVKGDQPWHYVGRTHEYLSSSQEFSSQRFDALRIAHHADGGSRSHKFERDLAVLRATLAETPDDPRTLFYLAQTHRDRGETDAARELYRRRAELGGWEEEVFYSRYQQALMESALGLPEATETLQQAWDIRPVRAEPLYHLARINRLRRRHHLAWIFATLASATPRPEDVLFVENWVYQWAARFERADAAWRIGEHDLSAELCVELLHEGHLPDDHREHLEFVLGEVRRG